MGRNTEERKTKPFVQVHKGIIEHLRDGNMTPQDFGIYCALLLDCDFKTGIVRTNANHIVWMFGGRDQFGPREKNETIQRNIRKSLERLRDRKYINYEATADRGTYPVFIHKYIPSDGPHKGKLLDAFAVGGIRRPVYVNAPDALSAADDQEESPGQADSGLRLDHGPLDTVSEPRQGRLYMEEEGRSETKDTEGRPVEGPGDNKDEFSPEAQELAPSEPSTNHPASANANLIRIQEKRARYLASLIYRLSDHSANETLLEEGAQHLLPIVQTEANWDHLKIRLAFALIESKKYPMHNRETGTSFTWHSAISRAVNPVTSFIKNYDKIVRATAEWAERVLRQQRKDQQNGPESPALSQSTWAAHDACFTAAEQ